MLVSGRYHHGYVIFVSRDEDYDINAATIGTGIRMFQQS